MSLEPGFLERWRNACSSPNAGIWRYQAGGYWVSNIDLVVEEIAVPMVLRRCLRLDAGIVDPPVLISAGEAMYFADPEVEQPELAIEWTDAPKCRLVLWSAPDQATSRAG